MSFSPLPSLPPWRRRQHGLTAVLLAVLAAQPGRPAGADPEQLVPGVAATHTIQEGETQAYEVRLSAGDFLRVTVDQEAVDLAVELLAPDGRQLSLVDGPGPVSDYGTEDLAVVAEAGGVYRIRVRAGFKNAPEGRYRIRLEPPHSAGGDDRRRVEAVHANQEATDGMAKQPAMLPARQAELREKSLGIWHALGERAREADTLFQLGLLRSNLGETDEASHLLHEAALLYRSLGDRTGQAKALNQAGLLCQASGHTEEALSEYSEAASLAQEAGARWAQTNALINLGILLNQQGRPREAIAWLEKARQLSGGLHCADCQGNILVSLGSAHYSLFETQAAQELYKQALGLPSIRPEDKAAAYNNLGLADQELGNQEEALANFEKARDLSRNPSILCNLGMTLESLDHLEEALASYKEALDLVPQDLRVAASTLHNLGFLYLRMGRNADALAAWDQVSRLTAGHPELAPLRLLTEAAAQRERGDRVAAALSLEHSLRLSGEQGDVVWETLSAIKLARVERESGRLDASLEHYRFAARNLESMRTQVTNPDQRALFLGQRKQFYEQYIETLMDLHAREPGKGWNAEALKVSEGARARSLLDLLGEIRSDLRQGVKPDLLRKEADLRAAINALDEQKLELIHRGAGAEKIHTISEQLDDSLSRFEDVEAELRQASPAYAALTQPQPLDAAAIQRDVLADGVLLLEYSLGEERSYLWTVSPDAVHSFTLPGRAEIEKAAVAFYNAVQRQDAKPPEIDATGRALSQMILAPAEKLLGDNTLLVVGDGVLQYIPFSALPLPSAPKERLVIRHRLVSLPSASTLAVLRRQLQGRSPAGKTLAVLADPIFRGDPRASRAKRPDSDQVAKHTRGGLPLDGLAGRDAGDADLLTLERLPFSSEEAQDISRLVADPRQKLVALEYDASLETALSGKLADYRYVHFATHGFLDAEHPGLSKLILAQLDRNGHHLDGSLRLQEIYNLQLNADLVVLSACRTALGKEIRGEGLISLTRGFMYAGSARVLASLWSVEDRATWKLMQRFYRYLLSEKRSPAEALRQAQTELAQQNVSPYYWAGFSLQGEWR